MIDFRVQPGLFRHPKFLRLINELGAEAGLSLFRLWAYAAENRPMGKFAGQEAVDLELAAGWTGEPGRFVKTLLGVRFLDEGPKGMALHDWAVHQGWLVHAPQRSAHARTAAHHRWREQRQKPAVENGADGKYPPEFNQIWEAHPSRDANDSKKAAHRAYRARLKGGATPAELLAGVERYAAYARAKGIVGTDKVKMLATFLGPDEYWKDKWAPSETNGASGSATPLVDGDEYQRQMEKATR